MQHAAGGALAQMQFEGMDIESCRANLGASVILLTGGPLRWGQTVKFEGIAQCTEIRYAGEPAMRVHVLKVLEAGLKEGE